MTDHTFGSDEDRAPVTTGVVGRPWRADVLPWGDIRPHDDGGTLRWHVAAEDRWHDPAHEPTVRQLRVAGTPITETRVRVPSGDAVQRVWSVPDAGGLTIVEVENESPRAVAVAFSGRPVLAERVPSDVPVQGIELPSDAIVLPVGHQTRVRVALPHQPAAADRRTLPGLMGFDHRAVVDGWVATADRASRLDVPDDRLVEGVTAARCDLLLDGPLDGDDPAGFVFDVAELVRLGEPADAWLPDLVPAVERIARLPGADVDVALAAAVPVFEAADRRGAKDLLRIIGRRPPSPAAMASFAELGRGASAGRFVSEVERRLASDGVLLPIGIPSGWLGTNFEVHGLPSAPGARVSFAVRWHGERPAVLWEQQGAARELTSPVVDPGWSTTAPTGEALWAAPRRSRRLSATVDS